MTHNDLVYKVSARARELANRPMPELRYAAGTADTWSGAQREHRFKKRGDLVEDILVEEFILEQDKEFTEK